MAWWAAGLFGALGAVLLAVAHVLDALEQRLRILKESGDSDPRLRSNELGSTYWKTYATAQVLKVLVAFAVVPILQPVGFDSPVPAVTLGITVSLAGARFIGLFVENPRPTA